MGGDGRAGQGRRGPCCTESNFHVILASSGQNSSLFWCSRCYLGVVINMEQTLDSAEKWW